MAITTMKIDKNLVRLLERLKLVPQEPLQSVIIRLIQRRNVTAAHLNWFDRHIEKFGLR